MLFTIIILFMWAAVSVSIIASYKNQIDNLIDPFARVTSYILFAVGGPVILVANFMMECLEGLGIDFEDE